MWHAISADPTLSRQPRRPRYEPQSRNSRHPPQARGWAYAGIGWDATLNLAKSVTIVHTALHRAEIAARRSGDLDRELAAGQARRLIESAILRANDTGMAVLEQLVTVRTGGGAGAPMRWQHVEGPTIASFLQHSRPRGRPAPARPLPDPQGRVGARDRV